MTTTETLPRSLQLLSTEMQAMGGELRQVKPRLFEVVLPCRVVGGQVRMVARGTVGYFVRDGRNVVRGVAAARTEVAYWTKQTA